MKVLILAGGLGTRLRQVVQNVPKPMAPIQNRPFLEYLLDDWIQKGFSDFYLLTCHQAQKIEYHFQGEYKQSEIHTIKEPEPLGTGGALLYALDQINTSEELIVINGDTFFEIDFEQMLKFHREKNSSLTLGLRQVESNDRYSGIEINNEGVIKNFSQREKGSSQLLINAGVYLLNPDLFKRDDFIVGEKFSLEDDLFPKLIQSGSVYGFPSSGKFIDIGIPQDYAKAQHFFAL